VDKYPKKYLQHLFLPAPLLNFICANRSDMDSYNSRGSVYLQQVLLGKDIVDPNLVLVDQAALDHLTERIQT